MTGQARRWYHFGALIFLVPMQVYAADHDAEITALAGRDQVKDAIEIIRDTNDQGLTWLVELNEIPAPPFKEETRGEYYAGLLEDLGIDDVKTDQEGNVLARIRGATGDETIAVVAHLDTVFPEGTDVVVKQDDDQFCAPGIGDNGRGLVAMLTLAKAIMESGVSFNDDILLVASVGEEGIGDLRGVRYLLREGGPKINEFIAIDGGGSSRMTVVAVGSIRYRLQFEGPGGHSFGAFGRANPAHALARAIFHFDEAAHVFVNTPGEKVTYNIGRMGGGTSVNSIPFENWAEIDMRSVDSVRLKAIDEILHAAVARALEEQNTMRTLDEPLTVKLARIGDRPAGQTAESNVLVQRMMAAMRFNGVVPQLQDGSTDANVPIAKGIPAITVGGGGNSSNAHSLHECWVNTPDAHVAIENILLAVLASAVD